MNIDVSNSVMVVHTQASGQKGRDVGEGRPSIKTAHFTKDIGWMICVIIRADALFQMESHMKGNSRTTNTMVRESIVGRTDPFITVNLSSENVMEKVFT